MLRFGSIELFQVFWFSIENLILQYLSGQCCPKIWNSNWTCNQELSQVRIQLLLSTSKFDEYLFHNLLQQTLVATYKDAKFFQIRLTGFGTGLWTLQGQVQFKRPVTRRGARRTLRDNLISCFQKLGLSAADNQSFSKHLEKELKIEEDNTHLTGESHFFKLGGGPAAAASIARPPPPQEPFCPAAQAAAQGVYGPPPAAYPGGLPFAAAAAGAPAARGGALPAFPVGPSIGGGAAAPVAAGPPSAGGVGTAREAVPGGGGPPPCVPGTLLETLMTPAAAAPMTPERDEGGRPCQSPGSGEGPPEPRRGRVGRGLSKP